MFIENHKPRRIRQANRIKEPRMAQRGSAATEDLTAD
jgi:hypothetical protein